MTEKRLICEEDIHTALKHRATDNKCSIKKELDKILRKELGMEEVMLIEPDIHKGTGTDEWTIPYVVKIDIKEVAE